LCLTQFYTLTTYSSTRPDVVVLAFAVADVVGDAAGVCIIVVIVVMIVVLVIIVVSTVDHHHHQLVNIIININIFIVVIIIIVIFVVILSSSSSQFLVCVLASADLVNIDSTCFFLEAAVCSSGLLSIG
jgi:hypothetical protein